MVALVWNPVGKQTNLPSLFTRVEEEGADAFVERSFDDAKGVTPIVVAFLALSCSYFYVDATNVMAGVGKKQRMDVSTLRIDFQFSLLAHFLLFTLVFSLAQCIFTSSLAFPSGE